MLIILLTGVSNDKTGGRRLDICGGYGAKELEEEVNKRRGEKVEEVDKD